MDTRNPLLGPQQLEQLLQSLNKKYRLITLLMADAGLRVTEVVRLQIKHFDFSQRMLSVTSLKKKPSAKDKIRMIPLTNRIMEA